MKLKMKKVISCLNKDKAVIGKQYYFYDDIVDFISEVKDGEVETIEAHKGILDRISDGECFIFHKSGNTAGIGKFYNYAFIYPVEEKKCSISKEDDIKAEEMFKKLGYNKYNDNSKIKYEYFDYLGTIYTYYSIEFDLSTKKISLFNKGFNGSNNLDKVFNLSLELLSAINKQVGELGW